VTITAQDLYNYTRCAHRVYLDAHGDPAERREVNDFVKMLWEMGLQTEKEHLASLGTDALVDLQTLSLQAARQRTEELMHAGAPLLYQGVIAAGDWLGRPDLLVRRDDTASRLGDFYYEAVDIKAGRGWEERDGKKIRFKHHYAYQILFYREILSRIQGVTSPLGHIINVDNEIEEFDPATFAESFAEAMTEVAALVAGRESSEPVLGSTCQLCEWYVKCRRWVEATADPTGLFFVGKVKFDLKRAGLKTIADIAAMDVKTFSKGPRKIPGVGEASLKRMKERAAVTLAGKPRIRSGFRLPEAVREIFFDIEDDPTRDIVYFYGIIVRESGQAPAFRYFMADAPVDEEATVRSFWRFIEENPLAVFYVYSPKERSTLKRLMHRYQLDPAIFERYVAQEFDLYTDLVVPYSDWPTYSYGIKQIARQIGFAWRDVEAGGANSIAWYNAYLADSARPELKQRIVDYNEDDCRAMIAVRDYFARWAVATAQETDAKETA